MAKFRNINFKSKKTWKNILIIGLAIITLVGAIVGLSALFRKSEETTKEINPTYAIGGLTETGAYLETKESIYTKDAFECYGLKTSLEFDNNISYRLYFYNENNSFIESTEKLTDAFDSEDTSLPFGAKYCRVVITPNEDSKISWYEKSGYAKQLTIKVAKVQKDVKISEDLLVWDSSLEGKYFNNSLTSYGTSESFRSSKIIDLTGYSQVKVCFSKVLSGMYSKFAFAGTDVNLSFLSSYNLEDMDYVVDGSIYYVVIDIPVGASCCGLSGLSLDGCSYSIYAC